MSRAEYCSTGSYYCWLAEGCQTGSVGQSPSNIWISSSTWLLMVEMLNYLHAVCEEEKCVETCVKTTDQSAVKRVKTCQLGDWCNSVLALPAGSDRGGSKARAKTPTHRLLTPPFETENIPVYTPPTEQQSTNLPGDQLNSRAGIVKEKKMHTWHVVLQSKAGADGADPCV